MLHIPNHYIVDMLFPYAERRKIQKRLWGQAQHWLRALPPDHPAHRQLLRSYKDNQDYPVLPYMVEQRPDARKAPIVRIARLQLMLLLHDLDLPLSAICHLGARHGFFHGYALEDLESLYPEGDNLQTIQQNHMLSEADLLLGGTVWQPGDYLKQSSYPQRPVDPRRLKKLNHAWKHLSSRAREACTDTYVAYATYRWAYNASVWALRNSPQYPPLHFPYHYQRFHHYDQALPSLQDHPVHLPDHPGSRRFGSDAS